jgi:hypothetical protein
MSGHGGHKHRKKALRAKRRQTERAGKANIARVRKQFEDKGQDWDPKSNAIQAGALNHAARRILFGAAPKKA